MAQQRQGIFILGVIMYFYKLTNIPPNDSKGIYPFVTQVEKNFNFISTTVFGNTDIWRDYWEEYLNNVDTAKKLGFFNGKLEVTRR